MSEEIMSLITQKLNEFRFAILDLEKLRVPTVEDMIIIQRNFAEDILEVLEAQRQEWADKLEYELNDYVGSSKYVSSRHVKAMKSFIAQLRGK